MLKKKIIFYIILTISILLLICLSLIVYKDIDLKFKNENNQKTMYEFIEISTGKKYYLYTNQYG